MMLQTIDGTTKFRSVAASTSAVKDNILCLDHGTGNVGIGTASPDNTLHVHKATAGTVDGYSNAPLVVENNDHCYIQLLSPNDVESGLYMGDPEDVDVGTIGYAHSTNAMFFKTNGTERMRIDSAGSVTKPLQPAFCVSPSSSQDNIAINTEVTIIFGTERFDQGGDFASNTFTAPVTGKYQLNAVIRIDGLDIDAAYYDLKFQTSNQTYTTALFDPDGLDSDPAYWNMAGSVLADMDASDTAYVVLRQSAGAAQADISADSFFSGYLAC
jgi:hypothetical protein